MAYDVDLAARVREILVGTRQLTEKKQFGGAAYLVRGNVACGIIGNDLLLRIDPQTDEEVLRDPHAKPFSLGDRPPSKGWVIIQAGGLASAKSLKAWVDRGVAFARSLPPK